jgi:hypothetical protein
LQEEEKGNRDALEPLLDKGFTIIRSGGKKQDWQKFLDLVPDNKGLGRTADQVGVRLFGECAIFASRVTATRDEEGDEVVSRFWNTRLFRRPDKEWRCISWQVMKICDSWVNSLTLGGGVKFSFCSHLCNAF